MELYRSFLITDEIICSCVQKFGIFEIVFKTIALDFNMVPKFTPECASDENFDSIGGKEGAYKTQTV